MYKIILSSYLLFLYILGCCYMEDRQEAAKVTYVNPKYIRDVVVFTARKSRHDPYLTNMTGTLLTSIGNNVSSAVIIQMKNGGDFPVQAKVCQSFKMKWLRDFTAKYTNLSVELCPIPPGRYIYMNMELPPKNLPLPLPDGDYNIRFEIFVTATKEKMFAAACTIHHKSNKKKEKEVSKKPKPNG